MSLDPWLIIGFALVAVGYSMVGHGGASGYLALWAFTNYSAELGAVTALVLNVIVAGLTFVLFQRAKHFDFKFTWPFLALSIPLAYLGGKMLMDSRIQSGFLALILLYSAVMLVVRPQPRDEVLVPPNRGASVAVGGGIGFVSGMFGVGGGIFLSPLMILLRWTRPHTVAALSAVFIFANSLAGLAARPPETVARAVELWPLLAVGAGGSLIGGWLGSRRASSQTLRQVLAVVLLLAVGKLVTKTLGL